MQVRDAWAREDLGTFTGSYTAVNVPVHGVSLLRLSAASYIKQFD
jgi:hypothetical protein